MNVYKIELVGGYTQNHCVVAENMCQAERIFENKYWPTEIKSISLFSNYVQIQGHDEQARAKE